MITNLPSTFLTLQSDVRSRSGFALCSIPDYSNLEWQETSGLGAGGGANRGYARFTLPANSAAMSFIRATAVVRIDDAQPYNPTTPVRTWEFRVTEIDDKAEAPDVVVTCAPIIEDFGRTQMRSIAGGVPSKTVTFIGTPTQFLAVLLLPSLSADGITGISIGDVSPTQLYSFSGRNVTVLGVLTWLETQTACDAWLERTSETTYLLHLTRRGLSAPPPLAFVGRNVISLDRVQIIDERMANRVESEGRTAASETDPTHIGQAAWEASSVSGRVLTLVDPAGGDGPIGVDDEVNGKQAFYALPPLHGALGSSVAKKTTGSYHYAEGATLALAFDPTRRILYGHTDGTGDVLWWRSVVDDSCGSFSLGSGGIFLAGLGYDALNDRIVAVDGTNAKLIIVNASTKAITATVTTAAVPWGLSVVGELGKAFVRYDYGGGVDIEVIDIATHASVGSLATTNDYDGRTSNVLYHAGTSRLFAFSGGTFGDPTGPFRWFNATTFAAIGSGTGVLGAMAPSPSSTTLNGLTRTLRYSINPTTGVVTTTALTDYPNGIATGSQVSAILACGRLFLVGTTSAAALDLTTNLWLAPVADVGTSYHTNGFYSGVVVERGPTDPENCILYVGEKGVTRRFVLTGGDLAISPFESWTIADSDTSSETITAPASGSGGPTIIPTEADGAGQGVEIEIRENAAREYRTRLLDQTSIDDFGIIDAAPQFDILAKRNYWPGSEFDDRAWRSDDTHRHLAVLREAETEFGPMANRWRAADQTGFAVFPVVTTTLIDGTTLGALSTSIGLSGLNSGAVLSPGDLLSLADHFSAPPGVTPAMWYVRQRAVADGSGNVTVDVTPFTSDVAIGTTLYLSSPGLALTGGQANCPALYPTMIDNGVLSALRGWPTYRTSVAVPALDADSRAWVILHIKMACYRCKPSDFSMVVTQPFSSTPFTAVKPADTVELTSGELRDYWLIQPVDLVDVHDGFVNVALTCGPTTTQTGGLNMVVYPISLQVILAAASQQPLDVYGAQGPRALYQLGQARLVAGRRPTLNYRLKVLEDADPFVVGAGIRVRDPSNGVVENPPDGPRIVSVTRFGSHVNEALRQPEVELGNAPLASFISSLLASALLKTVPSTSIPTPTIPLGGGLGLPPFVDPGTRIREVPAFSDGLAGTNQSYGNWDFVNSSQSPGPSGFPVGRTATLTVAAAGGDTALTVAPTTTSFFNGHETTYAGVVVHVTAFTAAGATSLPVTALSGSIPNGTVLDFSGGMVYSATGGHGGGTSWEEKLENGYNDSYVQYTDERQSGGITGVLNYNDMRVTAIFDLRGKTIGYEVPLIEAYFTVCTVTLKPDYRLSIIIDDGSGGYVRLGTSVDPVILADGEQHIEFRAHSMTDLTPGGFVWVRINGVLVAFTPEGGGDTVHAFTNLVFTQGAGSFTHPGYLTDSIGFGTGSGADFPWYPDDPSTGANPGFAANGGIAGVKWSQCMVWDVISHASIYDFVGKVAAAPLYATTANLDVDDDSPYVSIVQGATGTYAFDSLPGGIADADIVALAIFLAHKPVRTDVLASSNATAHVTLTSGGGTEARYAFLTAFIGFSAWQPDLWYDANTYLNPHKYLQQQWALPLNPNGSIAWTVAAVNAISLAFSILLCPVTPDSDPTHTYEVQLTQLGFFCIYRY